MSKTMRAVVKPASAPGAELREVPRPEPGPGEVLVRVETASICGTDLHIFGWDRWAQSRIRPPLVFGHEFCGRIERLGAGVTGLNEGDFVSAEMHIPCGRCFQCRTGEAHICPDVRILGVDGPGCFAEYVVIPAANIWQIADGIAPECAAILDPLGNAVHTVMAGAVSGRSVAIVGCGPIGLMAVAICRASGASPIFAIEPHPERRRLAQALGADAGFDAGQEAAEAEILARTPGRGVDVGLEFSGNPDGIRSLLRLTRRGGRVRLLGIPGRPLELDLARDVIFKGLTLQGINGRRMFETWYEMELLLLSGRLHLEPLFTDRLPMEQFELGLERLRQGVAAKVLLYPNAAAAAVAPSRPGAAAQPAIHSRRP